MIFTDRVAMVIDGDTFTIDQHPWTVRLAGTNAPEKGQPGSATAKRFLTDLIGGREVRVEPVARDRYGRSVAKVFLDGTPVAATVQAFLEQNDLVPKPTKLDGPVGNGRENQLDDVPWVKHALCCLGRYRDPSERHGYIDQRLQEAIEGYQRDRGLKHDGLLTPWGETERTLRVELIRLGEEQAPC